MKYSENKAQLVVGTYIKAAVELISRPSRILLCAQFYTVLCQLWRVSRDHLQICTNTAIHLSIFLRILILRPYNLSSYIWLSFCSSHLIQCGTFGPGRFSGDMFTRLSRSRSFKLPHLHGLHAGSLIYNEVQLNAVVQMLYDFIYDSNGLLQVTGTSFILVFIYGAALTWLVSHSQCVLTDPPCPTPWLCHSLNWLIPLNGSTRSPVICHVYSLS